MLNISFNFFRLFSFDSAHKGKHSLSFKMPWILVVPSNVKILKAQLLVRHAKKTLPYKRFLKTFRQIIQKNQIGNFPVKTCQLFFLEKNRLCKIGCLVHFLQFYIRFKPRKF